MKAMTMRLLAAAGVLFAGAGPGWSADCGGTGATGVLCSCGDTVIEDHYLTTDPVISTDPSIVCGGDGLVVAPGVTLNLNGKTIRGDRTGNGITLSDSSVVKNGRVTNFFLGVYVDSQATVESTTASHNIYGIYTDEASFLIKGNVVRNNVFLGIVILQTASKGVVKANDVQSNGDVGIAVNGNGNMIKRNSARFNARGIVINSGSSNTFVENNCSDNSRDGIQTLNDTSNGFLRNRANRNGDSGIEGTGTSDFFLGSGARSNGNDGIDAPDATNVDDGGNNGAANGGAVQCAIAGTPCK